MHSGIDRLRVRTLKLYSSSLLGLYFYFIYLVYNKQVITFELSHCYLLLKMQFNARPTIHTLCGMARQVM